MSLPNFLQPVAPDVAVEIEATHVAAAKLTWRGGTASVAAHATEALAPGVVVPALAAANINDVKAVARALTQALARLPGRARRVALVVPDTVAKVSLIRFEKVPAKAEDLEELVRWQIKKAAPFPIEDAVVGFTPGAKHADGTEFVVAAARRDIVQQYEQACSLAGVHAGLVDLATFSIVNGVLAERGTPGGDPSTGSGSARAGSRADWLLVHVTSTYTTLAVIRDGALIFFRNRDEDAEGTLADLVHQTAMYYEDRLQGAGFARVLLAGASVDPAGADTLCRNLEQRLGLSVQMVDPRGAASLSEPVAASSHVLDVLAPLIGIIVRERKALRLADARSGQAAL
jgi:type IV pilus assembly protein PilM